MRSCGEQVVVAVGLALGLALGAVVATTTEVLADPPAPVATVLGVSSEVPVGWAVIERRVRRAVVAVESEGCGTPRRGVGVVMRGGLLVTAAHVTGGSPVVSVDGAAAGPVLVAPDLDIASAPVSRGRPSVAEARSDARVADEVLVAGRSTGHTVVRHALVSGYLAGRGPADPPVVMRLDVRADPGDSGGPVVDSEGRLVGIVYASEYITHLALVIPRSEVADALNANGVRGVC